MNTLELAKAFTDMCAKGETEAAGKKFWSDDIVSREPMIGDMAELKGRKAVEGKTQWWNANHEVHDLKVEGPYVHGDQFVVRFKLDVTPKGQKRIHLDEVGLYTVRNGNDRRGKLFHEWQVTPIGSPERRTPSAPTKGSSSADCRGAALFPAAIETISARLLENFVPRCDQQLPLSRISSSNAQGNRFNQHEQEINDDAQVLSTPY